MSNELGARWSPPVVTSSMPGQWSGDPWPGLVQVPGTASWSVGGLMSHPGGSRSHTVVSVRDDDARAPAGCAPLAWRLDRAGVDPAAREHPRDHGVRVPHLSRAELVTTQHGRRYASDCVEHALGAVLLVTEAARAVDGLGDIGDVATAPEPDLVAEDPKSARPPRADGALGDDAPVLGHSSRGPAPAR